MSHSLDDVESFICEVQKYPELWDVNCEEYRHKHRKIRAWMSVAKIFVEDYDQLNKREKDKIYKKLINKWRNIRDSYVRHLRRKIGKNGYLYANNLTFLSEIYKQTNHISGSDGEDHLDQNDESSWASDDENKKHNLKKILFKTGFENDILWQHDDVDTLDSARKKRKTDIEFVDATLTEAMASVDGDKSFFDSLLPAVKDFTIDQKLEFRCDIIKLIKNYRQQFGIKD